LSGAWKDAVIEDNHLGGGAKDEYRRNDGYAKVNKLSFKNDRWKELYYKHYMGGFGMQDYPENAPTLRSYDVMLFEMVAQAEGFVNWNASSNDPNFIKRNYTVYIEANKTVSSPEARKVKFSVKFIDNSQSFSFHLSNSRKPTQCFTQISFITGWLTTHGCNIQSKFELKLKEETNHIEKFCSLNTDKNNSINDTKELTDNPYNAFTIFNFDGNNRTFCARASVNYDIECSGTFPSGYGGTAKFAIDRISLEPA